MRTATAADADELCAIYNAGIAETESALERTAEDFVEQMAEVQLPLLVADAGESIVGWTGLILDSAHQSEVGVGEVGVYVAAGARRRQIGTTLTEVFALVAEEAGFRKLTGTLGAGDVAALRLAERCNFRPVDLGGGGELLHVERSMTPRSHYPMR